MNILFVISWFRLFDKLDSGAANRSTMFVKALSEVGHVDVVSFCEEPVHSNIANCDVIYDKYIVSTAPKTNFQRLLGVFPLIFSPQNPDNFYSVDHARSDVVAELYEKKHYDIVACRYIGEAVTNGLLKYAEKLVVDTDDNLVSQYKSARNTLPKPLYWLTMPYAFLKSRALGVMSKTLLSRIKCSYYSNICEPPYSKSIYLHNVTTLSKSIPDISNSNPLQLLIVGYLNYPPNRNGVEYFVKNVFPRIKIELPEVTLHIVGKTNDDVFLEWLNSIDGVKALGYVDDLCAEYQSCRVVIVPVYQGAGTSVKFIEGMMMNRPIVSTPLGSRGLNRFCRANEHYMLAKTDDEFVKKTLILLNSNEKSISMARLALNAGKENFSRECFLKIIKDSLSE